MNGVTPGRAALHRGRGGPGKPVEGTGGGGDKPEPRAVRRPVAFGGGGGRVKHLVHARVDEEEARVAAGPHRGGGQAAVAVALLEEAEEGGADLPRRRTAAAAPPSVGAAAPAPRHGQQQLPPQPAGRPRRHGGRGRKAARWLPERSGEKRVSRRGRWDSGGPPQSSAATAAAALFPACS